MRSRICRRRPNERLPVTRYGSAIAALVILADQAVKFWVVHGVMAPPRVIEVTSFFSIVMVWNRGASFGLFNSHETWTRYMLVAVAVAISTALFLWLRKAHGRWLATALGMIIGGALGNAIDRLNHGAVADFLDFHIAAYHWPAFNVADMAISVGVVMLVLDGLIGGKRDNTLTN